MGSLNTVLERNLDPTRARILEAVRANRFGLKELSSQVGKNPSYLQQYLVKGSPRVLPEGVRRSLAELLQVPEEELRGTYVAPTEGSLRLDVPSTQSQRGRPPIRQVPLMLEGGTISTQAGDGRYLDISMHLAPIAGSTGAIQLTKAHGLLQPRHILICDANQATRLGDVVVALDANRILGVGLLVPGVSSQHAIVDDGTKKDLAEHDLRIWRVIAILTD